MAEEFDIMKPISADLDIGSTMFDKPQQGQKPVFSGAAASVQTSSAAVPQNTAPEKQYAPPKDDGVYNADYGYLTAQEAEFISDISEDRTPVGRASESNLFGPVSAAACSSDSPLDRAIAELESMNSGAKPQPPQAVQTPSVQNMPLQPYQDRQSIANTEEKVKSGVVKTVKVIRLVMTVISIAMMVTFLSHFFSVFNSIN